MAIRNLRRDDLVEPDLSYKIVGVLFRVFNELGPGLQEKYYQRAVAKAFLSEGIKFRSQVSIPIVFERKNIGRYFADFVVDDKIILELKKGARISRSHAVQLLAYLKAMRVLLGILAYFGTDGILFKRILNHPLSTFKDS